MATTWCPGVDHPPRFDLSAEQLLYLCIYRIYVSTSTNSIKMLLNRKFGLIPKLTRKDVDMTYMYLHDTEHTMWIRAKNMSESEKEHLAVIMKDCGAKKERWDVDLIRPIGQTAHLRLMSPTWKVEAIKECKGEQAHFGNTEAVEEHKWGKENWGCWKIDEQEDGIARRGTLETEEHEEEQARPNNHEMVHQDHSETDEKSKKRIMQELANKNDDSHRMTSTDGNNF